MSKGDKRRPSQVKDEVVGDNWHMTFGGPCFWCGKKTKSVLCSDCEEMADNPKRKTQRYFRIDYLGRIDGQNG